MHQFTWRAVTGQPGEAHDVCIQNAVENKKKPKTNKPKKMHLILLEVDVIALN